MTETKDNLQTQSVERFSAFSCPSAFEQAQRMAKLLTSSSIVPQSYRDNIADSVIALEMANRIGANPLAVMQNLYIVHGRPAWSSQFLISCINASGKFSPLRYAMTGKRGEDSFGCLAWAVDKSGERLEGPEVTIGTAKAEGWLTKNGSKWKTMPELMLRYRAATLFGLHTVAHAIQDEAYNRTRFAIIALPQTMPTPPASGHDCTSLVVSVPNRPGAVHDLLVPLKKNGVSMTRFESRPAKSGQWEYYFYIDIQGHISQPHVASALQELQSLCAFYKVLGSYPAGE